jgi:hypothetical protein
VSERLDEMNKRKRTIAVILSGLILLAAPCAWSGELRISTLGNQRLALQDEAGGINPYDFGRNPAYLVGDFEYSWMRFVFGLEEDSGELKREYDPLLVNNLYVGFDGVRQLSENQVVRAEFRYTRLWQREMYHSLELDQYNDPFYLTDLTTGDFEHYGPSTKVDYSLRLGERLFLGAGFDYDISTGLKQEYTRPEIVHNYKKGNLGLVYEAADSWLVGVVARPVRLQNRTNFEKTEEGFDNIFYSYSGDGIYELHTVSSYQITELLHGVDLGIQSFVMTDRFQAGALFNYIFEQNKLKYKVTNQELRGFWQDAAYDLKLRARYTPEGLPLTIGVSARYLDEEGWAKRPEFDDVLLYDNPVNLVSAGGGLSYRIVSADLLASAEYVMNMYDVEASDYGASLFRAVDIVQNIGRLGLEYRPTNVYSIRGGVEYIDYLVDRWLKLPSNTDSYRITGGAEYHTGYWAVELELAYGDRMLDDFDGNRRAMGGILYISRLVR